MFIYTLLISIFSLDFDPFEKLHVHNTNCIGLHKDLKSNPVLNLDNDYLAAMDSSLYLRECQDIEFLVNYNADTTEIPSYMFYGSFIKSFSIQSGKKITKIGEGAFAFCTKLTSFPFTDDITAIEAGAFCRSGLSCNIGGKLLSSIGQSAFEGCPLKECSVTLTEISTNSHVIRERAFYNTGIKSLTIPKISTIDEKAFAECAGLTSISTTIDVATIGPFAFYNTNSLQTEISTLKSQKIGERAFSNTGLKFKAIEHQKSGENNFQIQIDQYAFAGRIFTGPLVFNIPNGNVNNRINNYAFYGCNFQGTNSKIEFHRTEIGQFAFATSTFQSHSLIIRDGSSLSSHAFEKIKGSLEIQTDNDEIAHHLLAQVPQYAFYSSDISASSILYISAPIGEKAFANCSRLTSELVIDATYIDSYAFSGCTNLNGKISINIKKGYIPTSIERGIGQGAFECANAITQLKITVDDNEDTEMTIGYRAFYQSGLSCDLILHSFITTIKEYAFAYCSGLRSKKITIYSNVIQPFAFAHCGILEGGINIYDSQVSFHAFDNNTIGPITIEPKNDFNYKATINIEGFYGLHFTGLVTIKEGVIIRNHAFSYSTFDENILIDADSIGNYAFSPCNTSTAKAIQLSIGNTKVGKHAFDHFGNLTREFTLNFHSSDKATVDCPIDDYAFYSAHITGNLVIPHCFNLIGSNAFCNCTGISSTEITFGDIQYTISYNSIGSEAFRGCSAMTHLSLISDGAMKTIGPDAFNSDPIEDEINLPTSITSIYSGAFCETLIKKLIITHDSNAIYIGPHAFANCSSLSGEVFIPEKLVTIDEGAFMNCKSLQLLTMILEGELVTIGKNAFANCEILTGSLDIPFKVKTIGESAFANCSKIGEHLTFRAYPQRTDSDGDSDVNDEYCAIGSYAFYNCGNLKNLVQISDDNHYRLYTIGSYAFYLSGLSGDFAVSSSLYSIGDYAFMGCKLGKLDLYGSNLNYIGEGAFRDSTASGDLIMPSSVKTIGPFAFTNCKKLGSLSFDLDLANPGSHDLNIGEYAFYGSSIGGNLRIPYRIYHIFQSAFEGCDKLEILSFQNPPDGITSGYVYIYQNAFKGSSISGNLTLPIYLYRVYNNSFANCQNLNDLITINSGTFYFSVFENCTNVHRLTMNGGTLGPYSFKGCINFNETIILSGRTVIGANAFADFQDSNNYTLEIYQPYGVTTSISFGRRAFYNCTLNGTLDLVDYVTYIGEEAFAQCPLLLGDLLIEASTVNDNSFANSVFNGSLTVKLPQSSTYKPGPLYDRAFKGATGFNDLFIDGGSSNNAVPDFIFAGMPYPFKTLSLYNNIISIGKYAFSECKFYSIDFYDYIPTEKSIKVYEGAFCNCANINCTIDLRIFDFKAKLTSTSETEVVIIPARLFYGCRNIERMIFSTDPICKIDNGAFCGCSKLSFHLDFFVRHEIQYIGKRAFAGCSSLSGPLEIPSTFIRIEESAFEDCTRFSDSLTIQVNPDNKAYIGPSAFKGCKGFKKGKLYIFINDNEEDIYKGVKNLPIAPFYKYDYFLTIGNEAFEETKFKDIYYSGRFQPDCDYDIGFSHTKGIHTSSNFVNKTFCNYPLHSSKLSGGAIAGITIAVIVVVAAIIVLILFFIFRNKKNKDKSEDEVEMNADP